MDSSTVSKLALEEPLIEEAYDVVVVGAGPAGSSAARTAAQDGVRVLLIDAKRRIGSPVQCGELVSPWVTRYVDISSQCVQQTVHRMVTHLPDGSSHEMVAPGYMLDRSLFDRELAAAAARSGSGLSTSTRALAPHGEGLVLSTRGRSQSVKAKVIIAADGVRSSVARWLGLPPLKALFAIQYEVVQTKPQDHVDIFFRPEYEGGYGWFFPKGNTANVGVGVALHKASTVAEGLNTLISHLLQIGKLSRLAILGRTAGLVPCQIRPRTVFGKVLFVGDAAGQAHPVTGAGILHAVMAGQIAGRIAAEAVRLHDFGRLNDYESQWRSSFGETLLYGAERRAILEQEWNDSKQGFEDLIRRTWVGFKTYHQERRRKETR